MAQEVELWTNERSVLLSDHLEITNIIGNSNYIIHTCIHTYTLTHMHIYTHTYIQTYIHTYIQKISAIKTIISFL